MRFTEFGPSIPNVLLDARDAGEVVFLCGAGISIPAGLPDFFNLTCDVADRLGCPADSPAGRLIALEQHYRKADEKHELREPISFDRIFTLLVRQFGASQVESEVAQALRIPRRANLTHHSALLDLARGPDGRRRLITTNFDRLFHRVDRCLRSYAPPHFPDLSRHDGFDGVVHLHGLLPSRSAKLPNETLGLVISGGDFGRAYLAEAWATRFVCDLLDRYIVVLLGYSADDPPVRYLLEGLNVAGRIGEQRLYAFAASDPARSDLDWRERGVTPIVYNPVDHHRHLWESIYAWADRARDIHVWRSRIVNLAHTMPEQLKPFERGQIAALCSSTEGAQAFAASVPPPPPEWLCVFDAASRYSKPGRTIGYTEQPNPEIDPLATYGLDDDPPRPNQQRRNQESPGIDLLIPLTTDNPVAHEQGIVGGWRWPGGPLNARLFQIACWIQSVMTSPTTVWWAAGRGLLHGNLHDQLSWTLGRDNVEFDPIVRQAWRLVLEAHESAPDDVRKGWHGVNHQIRKEGWTPRTIRAFAVATRPRLAVQRSWNYAPVPPTAGETLTLSRIGHFDVVYPTLIENVAEVPNASLSAVLVVIRANLERGAELEKEASLYHSRLPTLYPEEKEGEHHYLEAESYFFTFAELFKRLVVVDAEAAAREFHYWDDTVRFFVPLRLFAFADVRVTASAEVGRGIRAIPRDSFWSSDHARELLWALRARWADLSERDRLAIEKIILEGREKYQLESDEEYVERRASLSAERLIWMQDQGLALSAAAKTALPKLKSANPRWRASWAKTADASWESRTGWVKQETDPMPIADLPVSEVIARCDALAQREFQSFTDRDPFRGLVATNPQRAVAVLNYEARRNNYPRRYWARLFSDWPKDVPARCLKLLARASAELPAATIVEIRYELTSWFVSHYAAIDRLERKTAHNLFDCVVDALARAGRDAMHSGLGKSSVGGVEIPSNRMGVDYAINAPTGHLTSGLFAAFYAREPKARQGLFADIRQRLETLIALPDEGGWHPLTIATQNLHQLYTIDRDWTRRFLLPLFDATQPEAEAAWSGFMRSGYLASRALFKDMREHFLAAFAATNRWTAHGIAHLGQHLLLALEGSESGKPYIAADEARTALRSTSSTVRVETLSFLRQRAATDDGWKRIIIPFFRNVWPRDRQFQTEETSRSLVLFLEDLDERFPEGVRLVGDFLVSSPNTDMFVFQFGSDREHGHADLTKQYPLATLTLLSKIIDESSTRPPYGLAEVVTRLADALPDLRQDDRWQRLQKMTQ
jgi:hypothetical protein